MAKYLVQFSKNQEASQYIQDTVTLVAPRWISKNTSAYSFTSITFTFAKNSNDTLGLSANIAGSGAGGSPAIQVRTSVMSLGASFNQVYAA